jgi:hypothetical protein
MDSYSKRSLCDPPRFDIDDFAYWKIRMNAFLHSISQDVGNAVILPYRFPTKPTSLIDSTPIPKNISELSEIEKKLLHANNRTIIAIFTSVGTTEFKRISNCKTAYDAWIKLCTTYEGDSKVKKSKLQMILNTYNVVTMKDSESFDQFYLKLTDLLNQLASNGVEYSDSEIVMKILRSLE